MKKKIAVRLTPQLREVIRQVNTRTESAIRQVNKNTDDKIEIAIAQMAQAVNKALENHPTKDDHKRLEKKVDMQGGEISDIHRRVIDLEHDTPTQGDIDQLKKRVDQLESLT